MAFDIKYLREVANKATPSPWEGSTSNIPFYVDMRKPAPSMSKHDGDRPTYWRYEDGVFVHTFNPQIVIELLNYIEELENDLEDAHHGAWFPGIFTE